ncbi:hypothetical protein BD779DRAFT_1565453 [Infundibulicybe gibba]|nr:hypothetical protein BD779DRAFT_1565453 [Infundibulicybe gibba]
MNTRCSSEGTCFSNAARLSSSHSIAGLFSRESLPAKHSLNHGNQAFSTTDLILKLSQEYIGPLFNANLETACIKRVSRMRGRSAHACCDSVNFLHVLVACRSCECALSFAR